MTYHPDIHHRRSIRLRHHNYAHAGAYFVTLCTQNRKFLFGDVTQGEMRLNEVGRMVSRWHTELGQKFIHVQRDVFITMPNHIHFIIIVMDGHTSFALPTIVQWFKTMTTNEYIRSTKSFGVSPPPKKLWQCNYYERIIRDEQELERAREYIVTNPVNWHSDPENISSLL